ncbi:hypothetical protein [Gordonia hankookensis]|uniref:DUF222 domain-containing protein n=1 Tax=Gordonia hankookensis TaxID=589403 RepID=A0ABR7W7E5_9ACTN|nr:hypothetical protein [Gordonia hankookensis]MBD1318525.1 hypothetical protein [Gordonia hankookensis]
MTYDGRFRLADEVAAILAPLADRAGALPRPAMVIAEVSDVVTESALALDRCAAIIADREIAQRTAHIGPYERRAAARRELVRTRPRITAPPLTPEMVTSGTWIAALTTLAAPLERPLADALAAPVGAIPADSPLPGRRDDGARSDKLVAALRVIDLAAGELASRLDRIESVLRSRAATPPRPLPDVDARADARLREWGVASWTERPGPLGTIDQSRPPSRRESA